MPRRPQPDHVSHVPPAQPAAASRIRDRLFFAGCYAIAFVLLGVIVSGRPPSPVDLAVRPFAGHAVPLARLMTGAGLFPVYATICVALLITVFFQRRWLRAILVSIVTLVAAWQVSDACKDLFHRFRPSYFVPGTHETSLSYPSGHATNVIAFYGFWTAVAWASSLPVSAKRWIRVAFALWALAIGWSRLALGAHYLTDVIGGYLLGAAMASVAMLVYRLLAPSDDFE